MLRITRFQGGAAVGQMKDVATHGVCRVALHAGTVISQTFGLDRDQLNGVHTCLRADRGLEILRGYLRPAHPFPPR